MQRLERHWRWRITAAIENLSIEGVSITRTGGGGNTGALVGDALDAAISNCSVTDLDADDDIVIDSNSSNAVSIGGLVGTGDGLQITQSSAERLTISQLNHVGSTNLYIGGLIGRLFSNCGMENCDSMLQREAQMTETYSAYLRINVEDANPTNLYTGGLAGGIGSIGTFRDNYSYGNTLRVSINSTNAGLVGGIIGGISPTVMGTGGRGPNIVISNTYALGTVLDVKSGNTFGGLIGTFSYWYRFRCCNPKFLCGI